MRAALLHLLSRQGLLIHRSNHTWEVNRERSRRYLRWLDNSNRYKHNYRHRHVRKERRKERIRSALRRERRRKERGLPLTPWKVPCPHGPSWSLCRICTALHQHHLYLWRRHQVLPVLGFVPPAAKSGGFVPIDIFKGPDLQLRPW